MAKKQVQVIFTKNSPFMIVNADTLVCGPNQISVDKSVIEVCRCGKSQTQPYCDQSHTQEPLVMEEAHPHKWKTYEGKAISIHFNLGLCCHVGLCLKNLPSVFVKGGKPWINPDGDTPEAIIETIKKCPSGALTYSIGDVEYADYDDTIFIRIVDRGPLVLRGPIQVIDDADSTEGVKSKTRHTLCRCGKSKNKPFCDGSHREQED